MNFADYFYKWYETYRKNGTRRVTQQKYEIIAKKLDASDLGKIPVNKLTRRDAQGFMDEYGKTHRKQTAYDTRMYLKACMADAVIDGDAKMNPFARVEVKYIDQNFTSEEVLALRDKKKTLTLSEYQQFKTFLEYTLRGFFKREPFHTWGEKAVITREGISKQNLLVVIYVALKTGARYSEILGLTWDDILLDTREINIDKTWDYKANKERGTFEKTKNVGSIRKILVDDDLLKILELYKGWQEKYAVETEQNTLFIEKGLRPYNSTINEALKQCFNACKIEPLTLHKLRHTQASILIAQGVDMNTVAKRLGHADTTMIQQVYGHSVKEREDADNKKIMQIL